MALLRRWTLSLLLALLMGAACDCGSGTDGGGELPIGGNGGSPVVCDGDGDGFDGPHCGGTDCDDADPAIHPEAEEGCDGRVDEDCDGLVDEGCACEVGSYRPCYGLGADHPTRWVGTCEDGIQRCIEGRFADTCEGGVLPADEGSECDGLDQDCDGIPDGPLLNRCGGCGPVPEEICGNGLDDDCDGVIDNPERCNVHCGFVDPVNPPEELACCVRNPDDRTASIRPVLHSYRCIEHPGLPSCADEARACLDLDGDPATACGKRCTAGDGTTECVCGRLGSGPEPVADAGCGFETPCVLQDCADRTDQACYSGPPGTLGVGICRSGRHSCVAEEAGGRRWGACEGEVLPRPELCGNGLDDDCDGLIDEADGETGRRCVRGASCAAGAVEICGNGLDDDCDGIPDGGCPADADEQPCYRGPASTRGRGACRDGVQRRIEGVWGPCEGDVLPAGEVCGDGVDSDCDGTGGPGEVEDAGCCVPDPAGETCNGRDDDCDGLVDEGVGDACGRCGEPCGADNFAEPADCRAELGRDCSGVEAWYGDATALTLSLDKRIADTEEVLYFPAEDGTVFQVRADPPEVLRRLPALGGLGTPGIAVAADRSVWVSYDRESSMLVHFDSDGRVLCKLEVPDGFCADSPAIDSRGNVWFSAGGEDRPQFFNRIRAVHGARVIRSQPDGSPWPDGMFRCMTIDLRPGHPDEHLTLPRSVIGIQFDDDDVLWGNSHVQPGMTPAAAALLRMETAGLSSEWIEVPDIRDAPVFDEGYLWAGYRDVEFSLDPENTTAGLLRIPRDGPYPVLPGTGAERLPYVWTRAPIAGSTLADFSRGAMIGNDLWGVVQEEVGSGISWSWVVRFPNRYGEPELYGLPDAPNGVVDIGHDSSRRLWVTAWVPPGEYALYRMTTDPVSWERIDLGPDFRRFGSRRWNTDIAGVAVRRRASSAGRWEATVDAGWSDVTWRRLDWEEAEPRGSSVSAVVRFAATAGDLDMSPHVCAFDAPPADLAGCAPPGLRFARVELTLRPGDNESRPVVSDVRLHWTRW